MNSIKIVSDLKNFSIKDYTFYPSLIGSLQDLNRVVNSLPPEMKKRKIWMVNSTDKGGGVAEMLRRDIPLLRALGFHIDWVVIQSDQPEFFEFTKKIHNLIHGIGEPSITQSEIELYESVNKSNAESFQPLIKPDDIIVIHDPQPMGMVKFLNKKENLFIWRSHIGLDKNIIQTRTAYGFLKQYADFFDAGVFTATEYIPQYFSTKAYVIHPAIDPLSHKNREISPIKLTGILSNSGILNQKEVVTPPFQESVKRLSFDGKFIHPKEMSYHGYLFYPMITQISRWDQLKGFEYVLKAFIQLKKNFYENYQKFDERNQKRFQLVKLTLAGPDPDSIQDDPEGLKVLKNIKEIYLSIPDDYKKEIAILSLPMSSLKENALIVNALQRVSSIVCQNSLQEGFGLTVTEAMWKGVPIIASSACGIRQQVRNLVEGILIEDPENIEEISTTMEKLLKNPKQRYNYGQNGRIRVIENFTIFQKIRKWIELFCHLHNKAKYEYGIKQEKRG